MKKKEIDALDEQAAKDLAWDLTKKVEEQEKTIAEQKEQLEAPAQDLSEEQKAEYEAAIADMQEEIDRLSKRKDNPKAKPEFKHGKKVYELQPKGFRFKGKALTAADLEADESLIGEILKVEGQQILTEKAE